MWFTKRKKSRGYQRYHIDCEQQAAVINGENLVEDIQLIKGNFNVVEAADILLSMINDKIKHHMVKSLHLNYSKEEVNYSKQRMIQLREIKKTVTDLLIEANRTGHELEIEGTIKIRIKDSNSIKSF